MNRYLIVYLDGLIIGNEVVEYDLLDYEEIVRDITEDRKQRGVKESDGVISILNIIKIDK